ncbi:hypothetical protein GCM10010358_07280 [Streptomyces minutiscleroticus]|uniref:Uncharacterized protein n=1 Tax=Streptomyces minutiscleroticus TaxID=68238 RepID=A0A918K9P5_9ACTN|nr:hypothetical protein GCM10010358_07280 [Streptomyces minutiscleroticus]
MTGDGPSGHATGKLDAGEGPARPYPRGLTEDVAPGRIDDDDVVDVAGTGVVTVTGRMAAAVMVTTAGKVTITVMVAVTVVVTAAGPAVAGVPRPPPLAHDESLPVPVDEPRYPCHATPGPPPPEDAPARVPYQPVRWPNP